MYITLYIYPVSFFSIYYLTIIILRNPPTYLLTYLLSFISHLIDTMSGVELGLAIAGLVGTGAVPLLASAVSRYRRRVHRRHQQRRRSHYANPRQQLEARVMKAYEEAAHQEMLLRYLWNNDDCCYDDDDDEFWCCYDAECCWY
jgi:hypothetical protein